MRTCSRSINLPPPASSDAASSTRNYWSAVSSSSTPPSVSSQCPPARHRHRHSRCTPPPSLRSSTTSTPRPSSSALSRLLLALQRHVPRPRLRQPRQRRAGDSPAGPGARRPDKRHFLQHHPQGRRLPGWVRGRPRGARRNARPGRATHDGDIQHAGGRGVPGRPS
jgi:hypothetical protein